MVKMRDWFDSRTFDEPYHPILAPGPKVKCESSRTKCNEVEQAKATTGAAATAKATARCPPERRGGRYEGNGNGDSNDNSNGDGKTKGCPPRDRSPRLP